MGDWLGPVRAGHSLSWGSVLQKVVAIDAFLVLAGSVLTSYVGLGGLLRCVWGRVLVGWRTRTGTWWWLWLLWLLWWRWL